MQRVGSEESLNKLPYKQQNTGGVSYRSNRLLPDLSKSPYHKDHGSQVAMYSAKKETWNVAPNTVSKTKTHNNNNNQAPLEYYQSSNVVDG